MSLLALVVGFWIGYFVHLNKTKSAILPGFRYKHSKTSTEVIVDKIIYDDVYYTIDNQSYFVDKDIFESSFVLVGGDA